MDKTVTLFDEAPVLHQHVTGLSVGPNWTSTWSGVYLGIRESEHDAGVMMHMFRDGKINGTRQRIHGFPVDQVPANVAWLPVDADPEFNALGDATMHLVHVLSVSEDGFHATIRHLGPIPRGARRTYTVDADEIIVQAMA